MGRSGVEGTPCAFEAEDPLEGDVCVINLSVSQREDHRFHLPSACSAPADASALRCEQQLARIGT